MSARVAPFVPPGHRARVQRFDTGDDLDAHVRLIGYAAWLSWTDPDICRLADDVRHARSYGTFRGAPFIPLEVGRRTYHLHPPDPRARGDMGRIWSFMERNVAYLPDDERWDTFRVAKATLALGGGDCDDHVATITALARCMGYRQVGAVVIGVSSPAPEHIYARIKVDGRWVAMDTAVPEYADVARPGWEYPNPKSRHEYTFRT